MTEPTYLADRKGMLQPDVPFPDLDTPDPEERIGWGFVSLVMLWAFIIGFSFGFLLGSGTLLNMGM